LGVPLPVPAPDIALVRFKLLYQTAVREAYPRSSQDLKLSLSPGEGADGGAFYYRTKLSGSLEFTGGDYRLLKAIEDSTGRCLRLYVLVEHRAYVGAEWESWRGTFTCAQCKWDVRNCKATVTPDPDDGYRLFLDAFDTEWNLLATPATRVSIQAQLAVLAASTILEFKRIDRDNLADEVGVDAWTLFYDNTSSIFRNSVVGFQQNHDVVLFRYLQRAVPYAAVPGSSPTQYVMLDRSSTGWAPVLTSVNTSVTPPTVDYVKEPQIAGFKAYKLTGYGENTPFYRTEDNGPGKGLYYYGSTVLVNANYNNGILGYGGFIKSYAQGPAQQSGGYIGEFLSLEVGKKPSDYGYLDGDWVSITATAGPLDARTDTSENYYRSVYWRFGNFRFGRCFPLRDGLYSLLQQTIAGSGQASLAALLPPTADQLSDFLSLPTNPATGDTGDLNEVPRLLLSAASDIKRFGSSEAATRLLVSLKQFLADLSGLYDAGWFIDPATGWLRFEHRAYLESQRAAGDTVDLQTLEDAILSGVYGYRTQSLPRFEELTIASASTEDLNLEIWWGKSTIDYGLGGCVNSKAGENKTTVSVSRLCGDVAAMVLNGDAVPDSAIALLAPDATFRLPNANREVSATQLQLRYWRRGRAAFTATVEGPAPPSPPNTPVGTPPVTGPPLLVQSVRPQRMQEGISGRLGLLASLAPSAQYVTNLGSNGQLASAELTLKTRALTASVWLLAPNSLTPPPDPTDRQFDNSFDKSFH
jgi:hypothetical protein